MEVHCLAFESTNVIENGDMKNARDKYMHTKRPKKKIDMTEDLRGSLKVASPLSPRTLTFNLMKHEQHT